jgi:hypothetical protein
LYPRDAAIENMEHHPARCDARCSWHAGGPQSTLPILSISNLSRFVAHTLRRRSDFEHVVAFSGFSRDSIFPTSIDMTHVAL